jgi:hypothetical protein
MECEGLHGPTLKRQTTTALVTEGHEESIEDALAQRFVRALGSSYVLIFSGWRGLVGFHQPQASHTLFDGG